MLLKFSIEKSIFRQENDQNNMDATSNCKMLLIQHAMIQKILLKKYLTPRLRKMRSIIRTIPFAMVRLTLAFKLLSKR